MKILTSLTSFAVAMAFSLSAQASLFTADQKEALINEVYTLEDEDADHAGLIDLIEWADSRTAANGGEQATSMPADWEAGIAEFTAEFNSFFPQPVTQACDEDVILNGGFHYLTGPFVCEDSDLDSSTNDAGITLENGAVLFLAGHEVTGRALNNLEATGVLVTEGSTLVGGLGGAVRTVGTGFQDGVRVRGNNNTIKYLVTLNHKRNGILATQADAMAQNDDPETFNHNRFENIIAHANCITFDLANACAGVNIDIDIIASLGMKSLDGTQVRRNVMTEILATNHEASNATTDGFRFNTETPVDLIARNHFSFIQGTYNGDQNGGSGSGVNIFLRGSVIKNNHISDLIGEYNRNNGVEILLAGNEEETDLAKNNHINHILGAFNMNNGVEIKANITNLKNTSISHIAGLFNNNINGVAISFEGLLSARKTDISYLLGAFNESSRGIRIDMGTGEGLIFKTNISYLLGVFNGAVGIDASIGTEEGRIIKTQLTHFIGNHNRTHGMLLSFVTEDLLKLLLVKHLIANDNFNDGIEQIVFEVTSAKNIDISHIITKHNIRDGIGDIVFEGESIKNVILSEIISKHNLLNGISEISIEDASEIKNIAISRVIASKNGENGIGGITISSDDEDGIIKNILISHFLLNKNGDNGIGDLTVGCASIAKNILVTHLTANKNGRVGIDDFSISDIADMENVYVQHLTANRNDENGIKAEIEAGDSITNVRFRRNTANFNGLGFVGSCFEMTDVPASDAPYGITIDEANEIFITQNKTIGNACFGMLVTADTENNTIKANVSRLNRLNGGADFFDEALCNATLNNWVVNLNTNGIFFNCLNA